jgi:hypothetical protein
VLLEGLGINSLIITAHIVWMYFMFEKTKESKRNASKFLKKEKKNVIAVSDFSHLSSEASNKPTF